MIGKTISHYRILEKLGEGGMGVVYKAEDTKLDRTVALKFLPPQTVVSDEERIRFANEAKAAAALSHANICTIHEIDEAEGRTFIAMECVEGQSLREKIRTGPLDLDEVFDMTLRVAEGLAKAHEKGIIHRDIKPSNIMITSDGHPKIMDFGLAKSPGRMQLTKTGTTLGTVSYMSPEQARGGDVDHRSDIWSMGVVLYEMITGELPFKGDNEAAVIHSILNEEPTPMAGLRPGVPKGLEGIVRKALEKKRDKRYQEIGELSSAVKDLVDGSLSTRVLVAPSRKSRRRVFIPALIVVLAVLAVFFGNRILFDRQPPVAAAENTLAIMYFDNLADPDDPQRLGEIATNLLITDLSESRYVHVVSSQRLYDILKLLGREGTKRIDRDVASQVAEKANARWMLLGSILGVEPQIVVTSQLVEVATGNVVASQRITGEPHEDVFSLVDKLTVEVRADLSLPGAAQDEPDRPVADVTSHSPEAYRHYLEAEEYMNKLYWDEARESYEKAVEHDSTFAMAYFGLALTEYYLGGPQQEELMAKALMFSEDVTDREKRHMRAQEAFISGDNDRGIGVLREVVELYPDDKQAFLRLGILYRRLNRYDEAIHYLNRAIEIDPLYKIAYNLLAYAYHESGNLDMSIWAINEYISMAPDEPNPYDTRGELYAFNGNLDQAIESFRQAEAIKPGFSAVDLGHMHLFKRDYEAATRFYQERLSSASKEARSWGRTRLALIPIHRGRFAEALGVLDQGIAADKIEGEDKGLVAKLLLKAIIHEEQGDPGMALSEIEGILGSPPGALPNDLCRVAEYHVKLLAENDRMDEAEEMAVTLRQEIEEAGVSEYRYWWTIGCVELAQGNVDESVPHFEKAADQSSSLFWVRYMLAKAYLESDRLGDAVSVLEKTLKRHDYVRAFYGLWAVKACYLLGLAYERSGWTGKAIDRYEEFLETWKDADPGIPEIEDARQRLARLRS